MNRKHFRERGKAWNESSAVWSRRLNRLHEESMLLLKSLEHVGGIGSFLLKLDKIDFELLEQSGWTVRLISLAVVSRRGQKTDFVNESGQKTAISSTTFPFIFIISPANLLLTSLVLVSLRQTKPLLLKSVHTLCCVDTTAAANAVLMKTSELYQWKEENSIK